MLDAFTLPHAEGQDGPLQKELSTHVRKKNSAVQEEQASDNTQSASAKTSQSPEQSQDFSQAFKAITETPGEAELDIPPHTPGTPQTPNATLLNSVTSNIGHVDVERLGITNTEINSSEIPSRTSDADKTINAPHLEVVDSDENATHIIPSENLDEVNIETESQAPNPYAQITDDETVEDQIRNGHLPAYILSTAEPLTSTSHIPINSNNVNATAAQAQGALQASLSTPGTTQGLELVIPTQTEDETNIIIEAETLETLDAIDADLELNPRIQEQAGPSRADANLALNPQLQTTSLATPTDTSSNLTPLTTVSPTLSTSPITVTSSPVQIIPPQTVQQIAAELNIVKPDQDRIILRLDPPEMGRIAVDFKFDGDRAVIATLSAELTDTGSQLRRHADQLMQALRDAGFEDVSLEFSQDGDVDSQTDADESTQTKTILMNTETETGTHQYQAETLQPQAMYMAQADAPLDLKL